MTGCDNELTGSDKKRAKLILKEGMGNDHGQEHDSTAIISDVVKLLEEAGVPREKLLRDAGIDPAELEDPEGVIRTTADLSLWPCAVAETGDEAIGLHIGEQARIQGMGLVGYAIMSCPTMGEALKQLIRYQNLVTTHYRLDIENEGKSATVVISPVQETMPVQRIEHTASAMVTLARWITGKAVSLQAAHFQHPAPAYAAEYQRVFACAVQFGQPRNALQVHRDAMETPLIQPNMGIFKTLEGMMEEKSRLLEGGQGFSGTVRRVIDQYMETGDVQGETIAAKMAITPRTLQRRLKHEGTSLVQLVETHRCGLAEKLLLRPDMPIAEIAYMLGYSETSAFHRAFKRWTTKTPAEYRKEPLAG